MDCYVDSFAGGGGASTGIRAAIERPVDIAINHSEAAIAMHAINHPETRHYCESIWEVDPGEACRGKNVRAAWFSPDCTHFSRAAGRKPRSKEVRGLAGVVIEWARKVKPAVIFLENVREFQDWGPLDEKGHPIEARKGEDFRAWLAELYACGYPTIEFRMLRADRYGAPTTRERFYLVARRDGQRVVWPEETHGPGRAPVRTAAEIIDWSLPTRSIFGRKKPLAEATMRRIAAGLRRYVIESADPFIVPVKSWGGGGNDPRSINEPLRTVTTSKRGEFGVVTPFVAPITHQGDNRVHRITEPLRTVTCANRGELALATPFLTKYHGGEGRNPLRGQDIEEPLRTVDTENRFGLVAPTLISSGYGERKGQAPRVPGLHKPIGTVVGEQKHGLVEAFLLRHYGGIFRQDLDAPMATVTCREHFTAQEVTLAEAAWVEKFYGTGVGAPANAPLPTVTANGHLAEVRAFLIKYYGESDTQRQRADRPLDVVTTKARFGLVVVHGVLYEIVDIGLRMLQPRELFRAMDFPDDYVIDFVFNGKPVTKTLQIELCGNSVCPSMARALVVANVHERYEPRWAA